MSQSIHLGQETKHQHRKVTHFQSLFVILAFTILKNQCLHLKMIFHVLKIISLLFILVCKCLSILDDLRVVMYFCVFILKIILQLQEGYALLIC